MSNQLTITGQMPMLQLDPNLLAKVSGQLQQAAANITTSMPRLSFSGRMFNLSFGGNTVELQDRVLDVHILAISPNFHYTFYEKAYTGSDADKEGRSMSRYPLPTDEFEFTPTHEWAQRVYRQRAVVMLANDPQHNLYAVDFGYNSIKKTGNPQLGLFNLSQLIAQLNEFNKANPQLLPFMFTVQLSFTKASVPEVQFSLIDQRNPNDRSARLVSQQAATAIVEALSNGEVDKLMKIEYDSGEKGAQGTQGTQGATQAPVVQQPAPVVQQPAPVVQPQAHQPATWVPQSEAQPQLGALVGTLQDL